MTRRLLILLSFFLLLPFTQLNAQSNQDSIPEKKPHSPTKATLFSAVLPGLGQLYNRKYWKIPVVYAGIGVIYYFAYTNGNEYRVVRDAYNYVSNGDTYETDNKYVIYSATDLQTLRDYYRRNMELSWIVMGVWYVLNIIDATVDAHLFDYDIGDNLSLHLEPVIQPVIAPANGLGQMGMQKGVKIRLNF